MLKVKDWGTKDARAFYILGVYKPFNSRLLKDFKVFKGDSITWKRFNQILWLIRLRVSHHDYSTNVNLQNKQQSIVGR